VLLSAPVPQLIHHGLQLLKYGCRDNAKHERSENGLAVMFQVIGDLAYPYEN
jgi:hypothetical protein